MTTGVSNKAGDIVATWPAPRKGIIRSTPAGQSPPDSLYDASNVIWRENSLQVRPGLHEFSPTDLGARPTGAHNATLLGQIGAFQADAFDNDAFQVNVQAVDSLLMVGTTRGIWAYREGTWTDIVDTPLTAEAHQPARFTNIEFGSVVHILHTNGTDAPREWNGLSSTVTLVAGNPPKFTDWTTVSGRVVGIVPPYTVRWGNLLVTDVWPALNFKTLSDTTDPIVAIRSLGTQGFIVYKRKTIWLGLPTGGSDAGAFRFEFRGFYDGPAGPQAIVDVDGLHLYMTEAGRVAAFDGAQLQWLNEPAYPAVRRTVDATHMHLAHGVYEPTFREVYFWYPRLGDGGAIRGLLALTLTTEAPAVFLGQTVLDVTAGFEDQMPHDHTGLDAEERDLAHVFHAVLFTAGPNKSYTLEGTHDDEEEITGWWQLPLQGSPRLGIYHASGVLTMADRGSGYGGLTLRLTSSNMTATTGGQLSGTADVDLDTEPVHPDVVPMGVRARYFGVRYDFTGETTVRYAGTLLYGAKIE